MKLLISVQEIDEEGTLNPLPGEPDVVQREFDAANGRHVDEIGSWLAGLAREHLTVQDFDITMTAYREE